MTAATYPGAVPRSLLGKALHVAGKSARARKLAALARDHVTTFIVLGLADRAAFIHSTFTGLLTLAGCLVIAEWKVRD